MIIRFETHITADRYTIQTIFHQKAKAIIMISSSNSIGVRAFLAAKSGHHIDKSSVVLHSPLGTTCLLLLLFLRINLYGHKYRLQVQKAKGYAKAVSNVGNCYGASSMGRPSHNYVLHMVWAGQH